MCSFPIALASTPPASGPSSTAMAGRGSFSLSLQRGDLLPSGWADTRCQRVAYPGVTRGGWRRGRSLAVRCGLRDWRSGSGSDGEEGGSFVLDPRARRRLENAWSVRQDNVPKACEACQAQGMKECEWCSGSGYFVLGDKMLCEVPSRNTTCLICHGQGSVRCPDCLGTGFRARWLETVLEKKQKR